MAKYRRLLKVLENPSYVDKLTDQLGEADRKRFLDTHEVLMAEKELLGVAAKGYAARFPHL